MLTRRKILQGIAAGAGTALGLGGSHSHYSPTLP